MLRREVVEPSTLRRVWLWVGALTIGCVVSVAYVGTRVMECFGESKAEVARMLAKEAARATERWRAHHGSCPHSLDDLRDYTNFDVREDPWGNQYIVVCDLRDAVVLSAGRDGRLGTADDITSY
jgi:hypothetical protein